MARKRRSRSTTNTPTMARLRRHLREIRQQLSPEGRNRNDENGPDLDILLNLTLSNLQHGIWFSLIPIEDQISNFLDIYTATKQDKDNLISILTFAGFLKPKKNGESLKYQISRDKVNEFVSKSGGDHIFRYTNARIKNEPCTHFFCFGVPSYNSPREQMAACTSGTLTFDIGRRCRSDYDLAQKIENFVKNISEVTDQDDEDEENTSDTDNLLITNSNNEGNYTWWI